MNYNEVIVSGIINNINGINDKYIKFGITSKRYDNKYIYVSLNMPRNLYISCKEDFCVGNKVYVKGYLNSYKDECGKIRGFVTVVDISTNPNKIIKENYSPHIGYDFDGVMIWNGKRCESVLATPEEQTEMKRLIDSVTNKRVN